KLRLISKIDGRLGDMVRRPDGNFLSNHIFTYLFKELADGGYRQAVKKWKVIQRGNEFTFQLVKGEEFSREVLDYIERFMNNKVGMTISIKYEFRSHITRESSGKLRYFIREK
ncbi:MAG: hypothetical protein JXB60_04865, partial [Candidatus Cloacimonetes bacterium]|nr:hypothetical protein [Candidatus Cloacimonadota bacterium]